MKILVFCPTTNRLNPEVVNRLLRQIDVEFFDVWFSRDNPYLSLNQTIYLNIQLNYEKMREVALSQNYEKVWIVEEDVLVPLDALKKLLEVDAPVVSGLYLMRHGQHTPNMMRYKDQQGTDGLISLDEMKQNWGKTIQILGGCMGCLLIDRSVLEKFSFRLENQQSIAPDMPFMEYCAQNNIKQMGRLDVVCGHVRLNERILYPDELNGYIEVENAR